ncbi:MAG TPA: VWA domain-containing protein [Pyrinomonadaceae bacterium]
MCAALAVPAGAQNDAPRPFPFGYTLKRPKAAAPARAPAKPKPDDGEDSEEEVIRVDTSLVLLDVLVADAGGTRPVEGLRREDFSVVEDGRPQEVSFFALGDDAERLPRSIVLILDRSQSQLAYLEASVEAAKKLVGQLAPADEMAIATDDVHLVTGFTKDKKRLRQTLDLLKKWTLEGYHTRSMQFSTLLATVRELTAGKRRAVVILQTDGDEVGRLSKWPPVAGEQVTSYDYDMDDVYAEVERSRVKVYVVVPNERLLGLPPSEAEARALATLEKQRAARLKTRDMWYGLKRLPPEPSKTTPKGTTPAALVVPEGVMKEFEEKMRRRAVETLVQGQAAADRVAEVSGGWTSFLERPEQAGEIYARILADINRRYVVGYYPTNKAADGTLRKVKVEVRGHPEYFVQGRRSYYAAPR